MLGGRGGASLPPTPVLAHWHRQGSCPQQGLASAVLVAGQCPGALLTLLFFLVSPASFQAHRTQGTCVTSAQQE